MASAVTYVIWPRKPDDLLARSVTAATPGAGSVTLFELSLDPAGDLNALQAGAFALATLAFDTLAVGTSLLGLTVNALGDADGNLLIADAVGTGTIAVTPQAVPAPGALLLLGGALAALGLRGRR